MCRGAAFQAHLKSEVVGATRDEAVAGAGERRAAAHGLADGLPDAALVVAQRAPVHHHLHLPGRQTRPALRAVCHQRQLFPARALFCTVQHFMWQADLVGVAHFVWEGFAMLDAQV